MGLALAGRRKRRSNLLPADLSFARITYWSKLIGTHSLAALPQLELFRAYNCHTSSRSCVGYGLLGPSMGLALAGRSKRRSNLIPADLSFARITYWSKFIETHSPPCREVASKQRLFLLRRFFLLFEPGPDAGFLTPPQTLNVVVMAQQNQA